MFYSHILELNVNEWVPVKGCILGIWTDGPSVVNTTFVQTSMGYDYNVIQVVCWVEILEKRRLSMIFFCENMDIDKWDTIV